MGGVLATGWSRPTERKGREMKRRKGDDVPGYGAAEIFTRDGAALLLPVSEVNALKEARVAAREAITNSLAEAAAVDHIKASAAPSEPDDDQFGPEAEDPVRRKIFDIDEVASMLEMHGKGDRERLTQLKVWATQMSRDGGYRQVQPFPEHLDGLRAQFPNALHVIDAIESLAALSAGHEGSFVPEPLLLAGPPGVGKTLLVESLAAVAGVDLEAVALGAAQGGFQILGTSLHWSTANPGQVWRLLAAGHAANGVLLLDELDKAGGDERCLTETALLDLLDPRTARRIIDQAANVAMDASALWKVGTANNLNGISEPIRSRLEVFMMESPTRSELIEVYSRQWDAHCKNREVRPRLSAGLLAKMADIRMSPREASRRLRFTLGKAVRDGVQVVDDLFGSERATRQPIGFAPTH